jgi:hypothetical protein
MSDTEINATDSIEVRLEAAVSMLPESITGYKLAAVASSVLQRKVAPQYIYQRINAGKLRTSAAYVHGDDCDCVDLNGDASSCEEKQVVRRISQQDAARWLTKYVRRNK